MYAKILVPVDGSGTSKLGLEEAIRLAKSQGSQLRLVHVVNEYIIDDMYAPGFYSGTLIEALQEAGKKIMADAQARVRQEGLACEGIVLESLGGSAAKFILEQAAQWPADLIVMGTHGRRGVARITLGSDAEHVLREATVPVLLVRSPSQRRTGSPESRAGDVRAA